MGCPAPLDFDQQRRLLLRRATSSHGRSSSVDDPGPTGSTDSGPLYGPGSFGNPSKNVARPTITSSDIVCHQRALAATRRPPTDGPGRLIQRRRHLPTSTSTGASGLAGLGSTASLHERGQLLGPCLSEAARSSPGSWYHAPTNQVEGVDDICFGMVTGLTQMVRHRRTSMIVSRSAWRRASTTEPSAETSCARSTPWTSSTGDLVFSAFPDTILEDIDAFHVLPEGEVVFSTSTDVTQGFGGIPTSRTATSCCGTAPRPRSCSRSWSASAAPTTTSTPSRSCRTETGCCPPISTRPSADLSFQNGDIVEYDPDADVATLYEGLDEATIFTGTPNSNPDIDALHAQADGKVIFSIRSDGIGTGGQRGPDLRLRRTPRGPTSSRSIRRPWTAPCSWTGTGSSTASHATWTPSPCRLGQGRSCTSRTARRSTCR